jgi:hypothetical protein
MFVVGDHEEAAAPVRALCERRVDARDQCLAELDVVVGVVVVGAAAEELRVDDGEAGQGAGLRVLEELLDAREPAELEVGAGAPRDVVVVVRGADACVVEQAEDAVEAEGGEVRLDALRRRAV